jgi:hypothetical protein
LLIGIVIDASWPAVTSRLLIGTTLSLSRIPWQTMARENARDGFPRRFVRVRGVALDDDGGVDGRDDFHANV